MYSFIVMMILNSVFLAPAPKPPVEITEADLIGAWELQWGTFWQDANFYVMDAYWSKTYGGGQWIMGRDGRVEITEGTNRYVLELKRDGTGFVGTGWTTRSNGTRDSYPVRMRKIE